jgi:hypothetical protein
MKQVLADNAKENAGKLIANMIIDRQIQKMEMRKKFKQQQASDDEKW